MNIADQTMMRPTVQNISIRIIAALIAVGMSISAFPQSTNTLQDSASLNDCISYAMDHQPMVKQLKLDEKINRQDIRIAYSDWLPQITSSADYQRYLKQPVIFLPNFSDPSGPNREITTGVKNNSTISFSASQVIFNQNVYLAARTADYYRKQAKQNNEDVLIGLVVDITKAYYAVLSTTQQIRIIREDTVRITKSLHDAYARYEAGASDEIDYKRAQISLNNAKAQLTSASQNLEVARSNLKKLIGYPEGQPIKLAVSDSLMEQEILLNPPQKPDYNSRIEYRLLRTRLQLQKAQVDYYRFSFLPSLSGYANYNLAYHNDNFGDLYSRAFPNSSVGLTLNFPIFEGSGRISKLKKASLQYERLKLDTLNLRDNLTLEYQQAIASYKSSYAAWQTTADNVKIARDVYQTVKYQYDQGIKSYLEVIVSETDLRTAELNKINALFSLLSAKTDVERALGKINVNY